VRRTLTGALDSVPGRAATVRVALAEQQTVAGELRAAVERAYGDALDEVDETVRSGALLRGEVLARWHDVVGTGDVMRALETRIGRLRDRLRSLVTGTPAAEAELRTAVQTGVDAVVLAAAGRAAERAAGAWRSDAAGRPLLADSGRLDAAAPTWRRAPGRPCARGRATCSSSCAPRAWGSGRPRDWRRSASTARGSRS
jgi:hypothetical protein